MGLYGVITADIIDSKSFGNFGPGLKTRLALITSPSLVSPFSLSRGDEVQAVCSDVSDLPALIRRLRFYCRPCLLRVGVGIGALEDQEIIANSWEMSGEVFYRARQALESLGKTKKPGTWLLGSDSFFDKAFNTFYQLLDLIVVEWTEEQWQAIMAYEQNETQLKAAEILHVTRQNIQKLCHTAKWDQIKLVESNIAALLLERFSSNQ